jgi:L-type amino acid transporter 9
MTVAAANNNWFPRIVGTVGCIGPFKITKASEESDSLDEAMDNGESPMYVFQHLFFGDIC